MMKTMNSIKTRTIIGECKTCPRICIAINIKTRMCAECTREARIAKMAAQK